jgi:hypothetical protein
VKLRVRNSCARSVSIALLSCGMLHLEYGFDQEAFCVVVVADHAKHFADDTVTRLTFDTTKSTDFSASVSTRVVCVWLRITCVQTLTHAWPPANFSPSTVSTLRADNSPRPAQLRLNRIFLVAYVTDTITYSLCNARSGHRGRRQTSRFESRAEERSRRCAELCRPHAGYPRLRGRR